MNPTLAAVSISAIATLLGVGVNGSIALWVARHGSNVSAQTSREQATLAKRVEALDESKRIIDLLKDENDRLSVRCDRIDKQLSRLVRFVARTVTPPMSEQQIWAMLNNGDDAHG